MAQPATQPVGDSLTVISSAGLRLTKVWDSATGKPQGYERAQQVSVQERYVADIYQLSALLDELETERNSCIIRGKFIGHAKAGELYAQEITQDAKRGKVLKVPKDGYTLRRLTFFKEQPLHFFYIDIDSFGPQGVDPVLEPEAAIEQYITQALPACFQGITYHWQLSSGAGHPDNPGVLKAHVAFWLSRAHVGEDLDAWVKANQLPIDVTVFRTVQPNYTAAPVFVNGVQDPVPKRSGLCQGYLGDEVELVIQPSILLRAKAERKSRVDMIDPRDKDNLVGQFCRAFEIEEVVERWLPNVFEFVTDHRLTWLMSESGAAEGAGVTDNRQGIFNTHNGDPFHARAANKWDLVRHYVYGHLDAGMDDFERYSTHISELPSELAMRAMVAGLPEMQQERVEAVASHREAIQAATTEASVREVAQRIGLDGSVDRLGRETLIGLIQSKLKDINGVKPTLSTVRGLLTLTRQAPQGPVPVPDWARPWCYVTGEAKFFNRDTKELIGRDAFDAAHNRLMDEDEDGNQPQASRIATDHWQIPCVYERMYMPAAGDLFTIDGKEYANDYRPESVPLGLQDPAVDAVLNRHFELLVPNALYRRVLLQWLAWVVTNPGKKVLWAILIKGVEGDGKSALGAMVGQAMGQDNVGIISPDTMAGSNFNDWANRRCVNVLEELKIPGHRHDVYNKIKPLITNPRVEIHGKGKASTTVINTCNYIGFSNHADALPLDEHDRRHFVLFTPWRDIAGMHTLMAGLGLTPDAYWDQFWAPIKNRPEAVRGFFEGIDLTGFDPHSRAPNTTFKSQLVDAGDLDGANSLATCIIEEGGVGISPKVISSSHLSAALKALEPPVFMHTSRLSKLLEDLRYTSFGPLKWKGSTARVWTRETEDGKKLTADQVRGLLDETLEQVGEDFLK